ncbi:MmgE/PrpD family protein [Rhodococcus opacus]|uniref:MmgE/PrpD family protein n=1 Tax=Rhodococcus opacus TaxID=37919 RepID=UPI0024739C92|nr:MmgE/PrpD family protein [Rhodococcus opacus]MDH6291331.1 2-methylcitrate dehydratase PrpD [Rhodococcus opacus]
MSSDVAQAPSPDVAESPRRTDLRGLTDFAATLQAGHIPAHISELLKHCILDTIGCMVGGVDTDVARTMHRMADTASIRSAGTSSVVASSGRLGPDLAALVNGTISHGLIFDDMHRTAKIHPGVFTVPAVLALNDTQDVTGADFLAAVCAGYETSSRLGIAINMSEHRARGWRATSTVGSLGAAAASARLLGLSPQQSHHAASVAAAQASGSFAFADGGGMELYLAAGTAARNGVTAALAAEAGFRGAEDPLFAEDGGLFTGTSADTDAAVLTADLGLVFRLQEVCIKMRPTCHSTQTAIDAALEIRAEHGIRINDVSKIVVEAGEITRLQCGWDYHPATPELMVFHMGFILASILETGHVRSADLRGELLHDPEYVRIAKATTVVAVDELTAIYKTKKPSVVHIHLKDGRVLTSRVDFCKGDPENPATSAEVVAKFEELTSELLPVGDQHRIIDTVLDLERQDSVRAIGSLIAGARRTAGL